MMLVLKVRFVVNFRTGLELRLGLGLSGPFQTLTLVPK